MYRIVHNLVNLSYLAPENDNFRYIYTIVTF
jgi:hypothetical protein